MKISLIWAMAANGVIGAGGKLPWRLPKDLQFFMAVTLGKPVIMGRRTFETLRAPLPGRTNIVLTRAADYRPAGAPDQVKVVTNFAQALRIADAQCRLDGSSEIMVAGGADVYRLGLAVATRLYVTRVDASPAGDTVFPEVDWSRWRETSTEKFPADERHSASFTISIYDRADVSSAPAAD
ncbi:MAG: dihydrofolate reductase [Pseudomonadales bacterium]|nr:dihydrofolate reductase [Pseudomonadales bacterium]